MFISSVSFTILDVIGNNGLLPVDKYYF